MNSTDTVQLCALYTQEELQNKAFKIYYKFTRNKIALSFSSQDQYKSDSCY